MRINGLLLGTVIACLMVGASGPAQAPARDIIEDFCSTVQDDAVDTLEKLGNAAGDLAGCTEDFGDCRNGGRIGDGDPLVECLSDGLSCAARAATENVEACLEYQEEFADAYERKLRAARFEDVEDEVQDFFNSQSRKRRFCLAPPSQIARTCADEKGRR